MDFHSKHKEIQDKSKEVYKAILDNLNDKSLVEGKIFFAGGYVASMIHNEQPNDYDIYFFKEEDREAFQKVYRPFRRNVQSIINTDLAHTYRLPTGEVVQFVVKVTGTPESVTDKFDFEHCQSFYNPVYDELFIKQYWHTLDKLLVYNPHAPYPVNAMKRMVKFLERGYKITDETIAEMAVAISNLNLSDKQVLKEQLVGMYVNTRYRAKLAIKSKKKERENFNKDVKYILDDLI